MCIEDAQSFLEPNSDWLGRIPFLALKSKALLLPGEKKCHARCKLRTRKECPHMNVKVEKSSLQRKGQGCTRTQYLGKTQNGARDVFDQV